MNFSLREGRSSDFRTLWQIDQQCFPPGIAYSQAELAAYLRRAQTFTVVAERVSDPAATSTIRAADAGGKAGANARLAAGIFGFIIAESRRNGIGHIITIDVLPAAQRLGAGSRLLSAAEDWLRSQNCHGVRLETAVDNAPAVAFYKRHNYELIGTIPGYYSSGIDALVLQRALGAKSSAKRVSR